MQTLPQISDSQPAASELEAAFAMFNQLSSTLGDAYKSLEQQVTMLTAELAEARSERLRELAEKEALANRLSALLQILPAGVVVVDGDDRVVEVNPEALTLLGVDEAGLVGRCWSAVLAHSAPAGVDPLQNIELESGRRISMNVRAIDGDQGEVVLLTDISDFCEKQEWMSREKRLSALGEMSARMAHQLRTPLSTALLYMSQLGGETIESADRRRIAGKVTSQLRDIESLVVGMLAFVRGSQRVETTFSLAQLLGDLEAATAPQLEARGGYLKVCGEPRDVTLHANREAILSALINLVENGLEHADQPVISIECSVTDRDIRIVVQDNGSGVPSDIADKIFDPFFTTRETGNGMGLAIAAMTAREYGGDVVLLANDGGAKFEFSLGRDQRKQAIDDCFLRSCLGA